MTKLTEVWLTDEAMSFIGKLVAASRSDWKASDPAEVGPKGIPVAAWREAYHEGCRDMANGIHSRLYDEERDEAERQIKKAAEDYSAALSNQGGE